MLTEVLEPTLMTEVLQQAFDFGDFSFARVPMNAADFSRMDYSMAHELDLSDFCLRDDRTPDGAPVTCGQDYKLDVLEQIVAIQPDLKLYVSSWSAPPSFKTQHFTCEQYSGAIECSPYPDAPAQVECLRTVADPTTCIGQPLNTPCDATPPNNYSSGFPLVPGLNPNYNPDNIPSKNADDNCYNAGFIRDEAYQSWAGMYAKFIQAYAERGVKMWGITSQNEPFTQTGLWNSNFWTVETLSNFVNDFLGPAVREVQPDIQIMVYDDQLINLTDAAMEMALATQDVSNGIAFHWYSTLESVFENTTAAPPIPGFGFPLVGGGLDVKTLYDAFNGTKFLLMSESCSGYLLGSKFLGPRHGSFAFGYNTAHDMLWDLKNRAGGYVYWNLILDSLGGPNHAGNYVDSPMYVANSTAFVMNPSFFYVSHFSRFVPPGSVAIEADVDCGASKVEYCQFVAFRTPNNDVVVVMTNDEVTTDIVSPLPRPPLAKGEGAPIEWTINCGDSVVTGVLPWKAIQTIVLPCLLLPLPRPLRPSLKNRILQPA
jgi:O-glycosyl hydrolase